MSKDEELTAEILEEDFFIVRGYDAYDNQWFDISKSVSKQEADRIWNDKTANGTKNLLRRWDLL